MLIGFHLRRDRWRKPLTMVLAMATALPIVSLPSTARAQDVVTSPCNVPDDCCPPGGMACSNDPATPAPGAEPPAKTGMPINLLYGSAVERAVDLELPGPEFGWTFTRSYDSAFTSAADYSGEVSTPLGVRWVSGAMGPYLVIDQFNVIYLVVSASANRVFAGLQPPGDYNATLVKSNDGTANEIYTLTETDTGNVFVFHGFHAAVTEKNRGRLKERTTRAFQAESKAGIRYFYTAQKAVDYVQLAVPQDSSYQIDFSYYGGGDEAGRLQKIEVKQGTTVIHKAEYIYKGNSGSYSSDLGSTGDLVQVKTSRLASYGTNWIDRYTQYRYYPATGNSDGEIHQLKMVLESDAIQRIIDDNSNIDTPEEVLAEADA
jgi:Domain of unknown function (DUF6531)